MATRKAKVIATEKMGTMDVEVRDDGTFSIHGRTSEDSPLSNKGKGPNILHGSTHGFNDITLEDGTVMGFSANVIEKQ